MITTYQETQPRSFIQKAANWLRFVLPEGRPLAADTWRRRHYGILFLLWMHVPIILAYALYTGNSLNHSVFETSIIIGLAMLASARVFSRHFRAILASLGLLTASSLLVHLSGGLIEMHFHYFVMIPVIALYQSWRPFLAAVGYVLLQHGVFGVVAPISVYNHPGAWANPWGWAALHSGFVLATSIACVITWRLAETASKRTQQILDAAGEGIYGLDANGLIAFVNPAAARLLGWNAEDLIGRPAHATFHRPKLIANLISFDECAICAAIAGGVTRDTTEQTFWRKDGTSMPVDYTIQPLLDGGLDEGAVVTFRDITDRKVHQDALKQSEQYYRGLFENAHDAVIIFDPKGEIVLDANQHAFELYGYSREEFIGMSLETVTSDVGRGKALIAEALAGIGRVSFETIHRRKDGSEMFLDVNSTLIDRHGKTAVMSFNRDITERKRNEQELLARQAAEASNRAKTEFLSRMSHEFRTPLNAILGFSQILEMDGPTDEQQQSINHILTAGRHLLDLTNEVLDISRIEEGRLSLSIETISVAEVVNDCLDLLRPLAAERQIRVRANRQEFANLYVQADAQRLKQVLINILANAVKYNRAGGSVKIESEVLDGKRVRLNVFDTGEGIAPEKLERLFLPFERLGAELSEVQGTGLGLALSRRLMDAMNGSIGVFSTLGKGSCFWIELPLGEYMEPQVREALKIVPQQTALDGTMLGTVLYVEDNQSNIRLVESIMAKRPGVKLITARTAPSKELVREWQPDLILLDLHLPDQTGDTMLEWLQADEQTRKIPVVVVSADATPSQIERLLAAGAIAYLTKPINVARFLEVVDGAVPSLATARH